MRKKAFEKMSIKCPNCGRFVEGVRCRDKFFQCPHCGAVIQIGFGD